MWNVPSQARLDKIPRMGETDSPHTRDNLIHLHFFIGGCDWYISEYDGEDIFFGFAIINNDFQCAEWGYISFQELRETNLNGLEIDCEYKKYFPIQKAEGIEKIKQGGGIW